MEGSMVGLCPNLGTFKSPVLGTIGVPFLGLLALVPFLGLLRLFRLLCDGQEEFELMVFHHQKIIQSNFLYLFLLLFSY